MQQSPDGVREARLPTTLCTARSHRYAGRMKTVDRRTLARGAGWAVPSVVVSTAAPAYAASSCTPSLEAPASANYNWGLPYEKRESATTTDQTFLFYGWINLANLPADAQITSIRYEYWIQQRDEGATTNGVSGANGPGAFDPGNRYSSLKNSCKISYSSISSCSYRGLTGPLSHPTGSSYKPNGGVASRIFTTGTSSAGVTAAWQDHTFRLLNNRTATTKAWQFTFTGDPTVATSLLKSDPATGCKSLPREQSTPQFTVKYSSVPLPPNSVRTIYLDRTAYVTYTSNGKTYQLESHWGNTYLCDSSGSQGGVNRC